MQIFIDISMSSLQHTYASGMPDIAKVLKAHLALIAADDIGHRFDLLCKVHLPIVAVEREGE